MPLGLGRTDKMFNRTTSAKFFAPKLRRRTDQPLAEPRPQRRILFSPDLASFASLRLAPWSTDSTEVELFAPSVIPQGESSSTRFRNPKFNGKFQICLVRPSFRNSASRVLIIVAVQIPLSNFYSHPEPNMKKL